MIPPGKDDHDDHVIRVKDEIKLKFPNIFRQPYFVPANEANFNVPLKDAPSLPKVSSEDISKRDAIEAGEVFDIIRNIQDPEHPLTLEQLNVVSLEHVTVKDVPNESIHDKDEYSMVDIKFT